MIAHVSGVVTEKFLTSIIIDIHGIGYEVQVATGDFDAVQLGDEVKFYTYHHIREQSEELFGFSNLSAKKIFEMLIGVQGVGPKAALAILSLGDSESVRNAIANSDGAFISKASGVGKKTAERVIVDLSDKVGAPVYYDTNQPSVQLPQSDEALEALVALGYSLVDATAAIAAVPQDLSTAERVRLALKGGV